MSDTTIDHDLVLAAQEARSLAYVPYSRFAMGAAVRLDDDSIVLGALVENVSLGLAMCGERVALFASVCAGGDTRPVSLALVAARTDGKLTYPCGACLQVALELGGPDLAVVISDPDQQEVVTSTVGALLPNGPRKAGKP